MKLVNVIQVTVVGFALAACSETAQLASAADVAHCKPLGEVVAAQTVALQEQATREAATHVVLEGPATNGAIKGEMYQCAAESASHSDHSARAGY